ncbi:hypothetical protein CesoFtcFv8_020445 [Champsocephalus esox]|uniref:Uncharacterized protein n=1 Tax=Champsocephalus esox TaxID=159716 RepID=A0AAN8BGR7_9TELE|nr:hypothetical protein CesoFtcFv8_020445 [Champsocephalus esox]
MYRLGTFDLKRNEGYWQVSRDPTKRTALVDESTSFSKKSRLIVSLRTSADSSELESPTADGVISQRLKCLQKYGLDDASLENVWWDSAQVEPP